MIKLEPEEAIILLDPNTSDKVIQAVMEEHYPSSYQDLYNEALTQAVYALRKVSIIDRKFKYNTEYRRFLNENTNNSVSV